MGHFCYDLNLNDDIIFTPSLVADYSYELDLINDIIIHVRWICVAALYIMEALHK